MHLLLKPFPVYLLLRLETEQSFSSLCSKTNVWAPIMRRCRAFCAHSSHLTDVLFGDFRPCATPFVDVRVDPGRVTREQPRRTT